MAFEIEPVLDEIKNFTILDLQGRNKQRETIFSHKTPPENANKRENVIIKMGVSGLTQIKFKLVL